MALLVMFSWSDIAETLATAPVGQSRLNPFDSLGLKDFNLWLVLMNVVVSIYGWGAWQNASAYKSASLSPHEGRMGGLLGQWREHGKSSVVILLGLCALTFLHHPHYAGQAAPTLESVSHIANPQIQKQMAVPIGLSYLLPMGVKGMLCAILLLGVFGGDSMHLHSWAGILVQDVFVPLRKKPFSPRQHILALRMAIVCVAAFAFLSGALFRQTDYIFMWWSVTQTLYVGGAGAAIIGGLYWKKATSTGAWAGVLVGSSLSTVGILLRQSFSTYALNGLATHLGIATGPTVSWLLAHTGKDFPYNGAQVSFGAVCIAGTVFVVVSLLTSNEDFNMDRMLHRGAYANVKAFVGDQVLVPGIQRTPLWGRVLGFDKDYTRGDKWVAGSLFGWSAFCMSMALVGSLWNWIAPWPASVWSGFWHVVGVGIPVVFTVVTGLWFTWGGARDIRALFRRLGASRVNHLDDGSVLGHWNLDEAAALSPAGKAKPASQPAA